MERKKDEWQMDKWAMWELLVPCSRRVPDAKMVCLAFFKSTYTI